MGLEMVSRVRRYQGQCRALRPLGHRGYRLRSYKKDPPLHSGFYLKKSDWEITKDKCDSTRAHRRHLALNGRTENRRKIYCTNVHLRIIEMSDHIDV